MTVEGTLNAVGQVNVEVGYIDGSGNSVPAGVLDVTGTLEVESGCSCDRRGDVDPGLIRQC